jgi:hemerythrin
VSVMVWTTEMSVGLAVLDDDHKQLIRIINQLGADSVSGDRRAAIRQSLVALRRYAEFHFAREEKVLMACAYPHLEEHQGEHRDFVQRIQDLTRRFDADPEDMAEIVNEDLMNFLRDWLTQHIMIEDKAYGSTIENNPAATEAAKSFQGTQVWWSG